MGAGRAESPPKEKSNEANPTGYAQRAVDGSGEAVSCPVFGEVPGLDPNPAQPRRRTASRARVA